VDWILKFKINTTSLYLNQSFNKINMNALLKYAIRNFFIMTFGMFIVTIFGDYIIDGDVKLLPTFIKALFFGGFMTTFFTLMQKYGLKEAGVTEIKDEDLKAYCESETETSATPDQIVNILKNNKDFKMVESHPNRNSILLKAGISLQSWGEKIEIENIGLENNRYTYIVKSRPLIWSTIADFGKNKKNVDKIISLINV